MRSPTTSPSPGAGDCSTAPAAAGGRQISALLDAYLKARVAFAQGVADCAARECTIEQLAALQGTVVPLLRPLLLDASPAVQQAAALALGRLANHSPLLATRLVELDVLPHIMYSLDASENKYYRKSAAFVLRAIARHSAELASKVVSARAAESLSLCLQDTDSSVKEAAAAALGFIARHNEELALKVVGTGAAPLLITCLHEPESGLRRVAASSLGEIARHSPELAQSVVDANAVRPLAALLVSQDAKLRKQACLTLSNIALHSVDLAECVVDGDVFPRALACFKDMDGGVRRQAAVLTCEIAKHSPELSQLIVNCGGVAAIVDYLCEAKGQARVPAIMALGYVSAFSEDLALAVIVSKGVPPVLDALANETDLDVRTSAAWALGQMGRHSPDHAKTLAAHGTLSKMLALYVSPAVAGCPQAAQKIKRALKSILTRTPDVDALDPLLHSATPPAVLKTVLAQCARILPTGVAARRYFVTSGACQRVQEIAASYSTTQGGDYAASKLAESIRLINACFPEEIVRYYSPGYSELLLQRLDIADGAGLAAASAGVATADVLSCSRGGSADGRKNEDGAKTPRRSSAQSRQGSASASGNNKSLNSSAPAAAALPSAVGASDGAVLEQASDPTKQGSGVATSKAAAM